MLVKFKFLVLVNCMIIASSTILTSSSVTSQNQGAAKPSVTIDGLDTKFREVKSNLIGAIREFQGRNNSLEALHNHPSLQYMMESRTSFNVNAPFNDGYISTSDPEIIVDIMQDATQEDVMFWDFDNVVVQGVGEKRQYVTEIFNVFQDVKSRGIPTYILSFGTIFNSGEDEFFYKDKNFKDHPIENKSVFFGTSFNLLKLKEEILFQTIGNMYLSFEKTPELSDFIKPFYWAAMPRFTPIPSLSPEAGGVSFYNSSCWHWGLDYDYKKEVLPYLESLYGNKILKDNFIQYLFNDAHVKGKMLAWFLEYLYVSNSLNSIRRNVYFIDDNELNCRAFLYYAKAARAAGLFNGNIRVIHYLGAPLIDNKVLAINVNNFFKNKSGYEPVIEF